MCARVGQCARVRVRVRVRRLVNFSALRVSDARPLRPGGGAEPAAVLRDAGDREDPQSRLCGPETLSGFLQKARQDLRTSSLFAFPRDGGKRQ